MLKAALNALSSVFVPAPCLICDQLLLDVSRIPICGRCLNSFERIPDPMCHCCGRPLLSDTASAPAPPQPLCRLCRSGFYAFDCARSFAIYDKSLFEAIALIKYDQVTPLGAWFGDRLAGIALQHAPDQLWCVDAVVPVPLHRQRQRERGYNQAELVARQVSKRLSVPMRTDLLVRIKPRPPQLLLSRKDRWQSVRGAYATPHPQRVDKLRILLVDDVMTTGATLHACARSLKAAGGLAVTGLTVGRMVPGWGSSRPYT